MIKHLKILSLFVIMIICVAGIFPTYATNKKTEKETVQKTIVTTTKVVTTKKNVPKPKFKSYTRYIKTNRVVTRTKPSVKAKKSKEYYKGQKLKITKEKGNWCKVGKSTWINKKHLVKKSPMKKYKNVRLKYYKPYNITSNKLTKSGGVAFYNGHKETWYSEKVLPGTGLNIPGRHVAQDGTIRDKDGYICVAYNYMKKGSVVMTSLGPGKVYDCGNMVGNLVDIYVSW